MHHEETHLNRSSDNNGPTKLSRAGSTALNLGKAAVKGTVHAAVVGLPSASGAAFVAASNGTQAIQGAGLQAAWLTDGQNVSMPVVDILGDASPSSSYDYGSDSGSSRGSGNDKDDNADADADDDDGNKNVDTTKRSTSSSDRKSSSSGSSKSSDDDDD
jgi:hypothetical protein